MPDVAIVNSTVTPAPTDYTVPGAQELLVKAVRASIDGSGAASSFLPALQLLDPAGHVMWTAVDTSTSIAAGGSADVSWFPGVKKGGSGSSVVTGATAYLWGVFGAQTIPSGGAGANIQYNHFQTNDTSIFGTSNNAVDTPPFNNTAGDSFVYGIGLGSYVAAGSVILASGVYAQSASIFNQGSQFQLDATNPAFEPNENEATNTDAFGTAGNQSPFSHRLFYVDVTAPAMVSRLIVTQTSGAAKAVIDFNLGFIYGDGGRGTLTQIY